MAKGDVNGDGLINEEDYILIKNAISKVVTLNGNATKAADMNGDNKITLADLNQLEKLLSKKIPGDANGDGKVTQEDVIVIQRHIAGLLKLDGRLFKNADMNNDGKINMQDVVSLQRLLQKIISKNTK